MTAQHTVTSSKCMNCGTPISGMYCSHCGQKHIEGELTVGFFINTFIDTLTNTDTRIFKTFRDLFIRPGHVAKQYTSGKRKQYVNPLRLCFVIIGLYLALLALTGGIAALNEYAVHQQQAGISEFAQTWQELYINHRILIYLGALPFAALVIRFSFYKSGYNYISTLIMLLYTSTLYCLYGIVMVSVFKLFSLDYFSEYRRLVESAIGLTVFYQSAKVFYGWSWLKGLILVPWIFLSLFFSAYLAAFIITSAITLF